jgi:predicted anti-sigma-YlaC factor YlaD
MKHAMPLDNACKNFEEDLVLYYYGENNGAERRRVEQHLSSCGSCQSFVNDLNRVLPPMAEQQSLPQTFWDNYYRETVAKLAEQDERKNWWRNLFAPIRTWMVPVFGTAVAAVLAVALLLGKVNVFTDLTPASIPQEILADSNQLEFFQSLDMLESLNKLEEQDGNKPEAKTSKLMNGRAAKAA